MEEESCSSHDSWEAGREEGVSDKIIVSRGVCPKIYSLRLDPTSYSVHHLPGIHSAVNLPMN